MSFDRRRQNLVSQFRGLPLDWSCSTDKDLSCIDGLIDGFLEKHKIGKKSPEEALMHSWSAVMGENMAHKCVPIKIDVSGNLIVKVNNPMDRRELEFRKRAITGKIQRLEGCHIIRRVQFIAG